jgi:hypothetical protein
MSGGEHQKHGVACAGRGRSDCFSFDCQEAQAGCGGGAGGANVPVGVCTGIGGMKVSGQGE